MVSIFSKSGQIIPFSIILSQVTRWLCLGLSVMLLLAACNQVPKTVKIGLMAPFEGVDRALGYEALFAVKTAIAEHNRANAQHGYQIQLIALNDFSQAEEAEKQAQALLADPDVMGVVGHFSNEATQAALPIYEAGGLAVAIPWTVERTVFTDHAGVVSVAASQSETVSRLKQVQQQMGLESVRVVDDLGTQVPHFIAPIQLATNGVDAGEIMGTLRKSGFKQPIFGEASAGSQQVIQLAGAAAEGFIYVSPGPATMDMVQGEQFVETYQALSGFPPSPRAVLAYEAAHILLDSIQKVMLTPDNLSREAVREHISHMTRQGISGEVIFDEQGYRINAPMWVYQISQSNYPGINVVQKQ